MRKAYALCLRGGIGAVAMIASISLPGSTWASPEPTPRSQDIVDAHLADREGLLSKQRQTALTLVRQNAWIAYRLGRRRELGFFADTKLRPGAARAAAMSVLVLNRSVDEAVKLQDELARVVRERAGLAGRSGEASGSDVETASSTDKPSLVWPTRGPTISGPGLRPDPVTAVVYRDTGVQILSRLDASVVSPADATVKRIANLPSGGYAVVLAHADGLVSILSGMRVVDVIEGQGILAGTDLGRVGRTLDGAPVLSMAVWRAGRPVDPRALRLWR